MTFGQFLFSNTIREPSLSLYYASRKNNGHCKSLTNLGWVEFQELDYYNYPLNELGGKESLIRQVDMHPLHPFSGLGRELSVGEKIGRWLEDAHFVNI